MPYPIESIQVIQACTSEDLSVIRELFLEYAAQLNYDLCLQNFDEEVRTLPGEYAPPGGRLYLITCNDLVAGCVALRKKPNNRGELKRLYLRADFRGKGLGRILTQRIISDATAIGYSSLLLDTLPAMKEAISLYHSLGFEDIQPPKGSPGAGEIYMELRLV